MTVRTAATTSVPSAQAALKVDDVPPTITSRIFSASVSLSGGQLDLLAKTRLVRPVLVADGRQVGAVKMADGGDLDEATGNVRVEPERPVSVWFMLSADVTALRVVVLDPATNAELYRSPEDISVRLLI